MKSSSPIFWGNWRPTVTIQKGHTKTAHQVLDLIMYTSNISCELCCCVPRLHELRYPTEWRVDWSSSSPVDTDSEKITVRYGEGGGHKKSWARSLPVDHVVVIPEPSTPLFTPSARVKQLFVNSYKADHSTLLLISMLIRNVVIIIPICHESAKCY